MDGGFRWYSSQQIDLLYQMGFQQCFKNILGYTLEFYFFQSAFFTTSQCNIV